jgi:LysR family transcriptional regulator, low CO2-responsive transcriptional regulator
MSNQPLDSRQLRAFVTVVRTGSFTAAARELFLSQSAISHSLRTLEEDIGCRLLNRVNKKTILTPAGEHLLHHAEKILGQMNSARTELTKLNEWGRSKIRVGASTTACQYILPGVLTAFKDDFPKCHVTIEPGDTPELISHLHDRQIDLAVGLEPKHLEQLEYSGLFTDELSFVVSPEHPWAKQGHCTRADIPTQNYIFYSKNSFTFRMVEKYFAEDDMVLNSVMELGSMEAIKEMVKLGMGVSVLAAWLVRRELEEGTLVSLPLGRRKLKRNWGVISWRNRPLSHPEQAFVDLCRKATVNFGRDRGRTEVAEAA